MTSGSDDGRHEVNNLIGELIRSRRSTYVDTTGKRGLSQQALGDLVSYTKQNISNFEVGRSIPSGESLLRIFDVLKSSDRDDLARWLDTFLLSVVQEAPASSLREEAEVLIRRRIDGVAAVGHEPGQKSGFSLAGFPDDFEPLTIIVGDRREGGKKHSNADEYVYSVSAIDFAPLSTIIWGCKRPPTVLTDKLLSYLSERELRPILSESNLLVVGSPAVNIFARFVNRGAVFPWAMERYQYFVEETLRSQVMRDPEWAKFLWYLVGDGIEYAKQLAKDPEAVGALDVPRLKREIGFVPGNWEDDQIVDVAKTAVLLAEGGDEKTVSNSFRAPGIVDPADGKLHGTTTRMMNDFGVVSVARHPFAESEDLVAVMAGGKHGPGTFHAIKALSPTDGLDMSGHPFGGVIEVHMNTNEGWDTRVTNATPFWQTEPYEADTLVSKYDGLVDTNSSLLWNQPDQEADKTLGFLRQLTQR